MKILLINTYDNVGGAAKTTFRLHQALIENNIDSQMLVQRKTIDNHTIIGPNLSLQQAVNIFRPRLDRIPNIYYKNRSGMLFSPALLPFSYVLSAINIIKPDIIHLNWINGGMIGIKDIVKIKQPIIWSLHDNWPFTGGCHVTLNCKKFEDSCGACPALGSNKENDLSRKIWERKQKVFSKLNNITIIGLSNWINRRSKNSSLLRNYKHVNIPNLIDTNIFKPIDKGITRKLWNIPKDKKVILYGAVGVLNDINKGYHNIYEIIDSLKNKKVELVIFGCSKPKKSPSFGVKTHYVGYLSDDVRLVTLYNVADVLVVPSFQENLSTSIMESLSCGIPVVAFDVGGNSDMIDHKKNGYLAHPNDLNDIAFGIDWILSNNNHNNISLRAREKIVKYFNSKIVVKEYIALYKSAINNKHC